MAKERRRNLTMTILSLSLLTVMAGAAVAPALDILQQHFSQAGTTTVQLIISIPALFIVLTSLFVPYLTRRYRSRDLLLFALTLYIVGGCLPGLIDNIYAVLALRALVGIGVGIIMPLSTGLLSFYYTRDKQDRLMGYSSAANQMGGILATIIAGMLAHINWNLCFLVYLMGIISIVLCILFLPNERIGEPILPKGKANNTKSSSINLKEYVPLIASMFFIMATFFVYPSCFAIETAKEGIIPSEAVTFIMAALDLVAFGAGACFGRMVPYLKNNMRFVAPVFFIGGYCALLFVGAWIGALVGSACIGFANGVGVPFIMASASKRAGRKAASTILPFISMALFSGQFCTPLILNACAAFATTWAVTENITHISYMVAIVLGMITFVCAFFIKNPSKRKDAVIQEK